MSFSVLIFLLQFWSCLEPFSPLSYLASKTPYRADLSKQTNPDFNECRVIHINHLARHGSRHLTNTKAIDKLMPFVLQAHQEKQLNAEGEKLLLLLEQAHNQEKSDLLGQLSEQGREEHRLMARRMYEEYSDLFSQRRALVLQSTHLQRTKDSLHVFLEELIKMQPDLAERAEINIPESSKDPELEFFRICNAYLDYKKLQPQNDAIENAVWTPEAKNNIKLVLNRIFMAPFLQKLDTTAHVSIGRYLYKLCQLDADIDYSKITDGFCSFFTKAEDIEPFNWEQDAQDFFIKGYAGQNDSIAHRVACPLLTSFVKSTEAAINDPARSPIANLRFAHAETLIPFLVQMGLYREDSSSDILTKPNQRKFRTSLISPMAGNVKWTLYHCPENQYLIRLTHNEQTIGFPIPGCEHASWCDWQKVKSFYEQQGRLCEQAEWQSSICGGVSAKTEK